MVGMYDEPVAVPILDLLDSLMMALYLSAAKEQYNKALEDLEKFAKEFGDLYSPSDNLNKAWYDNTRGRINNTINYLYQNGIDPFRSAEGRSIIAKAVRETPYAQLAKWKKEAENMNTYQKAAAAMVADGKLNLDLLDWLMKKQGLDYNKFDPYNDSWNTLSPTKMDSLEDLTKLNFSMLKPSDLTKEQVEAMGYKYDPMNDYTGITNLMLIDTAGQSIPNVMSSANGEYYYDKAKRELQLSGISNPTDDLIKSQLQNTVAGLWSGKVAIDHAPNEYKKIDYQTSKQNWLDAQKTARDTAAQKEILRYTYSNGYYKGSGSSSNKNTDVFDMARAQPGKPVYGDGSTDYLKSGINVADANAKVESGTTSSTYKDKEDSKGNYYDLNTKTNFSLVTFTDNGSAHYAKVGNFKGTVGKCVVGKGKKVKANLTGGLVYNKDVNRYYIKAEIASVDGNKEDKNVGKMLWVEVNQGYQGTPSSKANDTDDLN